MGRWVQKTESCSQRDSAERKGYVSAPLIQPDMEGKRQCRARHLKVNAEQGKSEQGLQKSEGKQRGAPGVDGMTIEAWRYHG